MKSVNKIPETDKKNTSKTVTEKNPISKEEYNEITKGLDLKSITLVDLQASVDRSSTLEAMEKGSLTVNIDDDARFEPDSIIRVFQSYQISCRTGRKKCLSIKASYELVFLSAEPFTENFFSVFRAGNLPLTVWPYFRELAQDMTTRMGLPPLVLPLLKFEP